MTMVFTAFLLGAVYRHFITRYLITRHLITIGLGFRVRDETLNRVRARVRVRVRNG